MPELTDVPAATTVDNPHGPNADDRDFHGVVTGRPAVWLRVEGLAVAIAALVLFATTDEPWWLVPALFLVPDLSWFAYLAGPKVGAWVYNLMHTAPLPLALIVAGSTWEHNSLIVAGVIGLFHLGFDRVLKYGVKYDHSFIVTHLGIHGPDKHR
ncbi:DUF4260 domain-containing protein [Actinacidiphila glaucinigra]